MGMLVKTVMVIKECMGRTVTEREMKKERKS